MTTWEEQQELDLQEVGAITRMIRNHEQAIVDLSKTRTKIFIRLWKRRTPYSKIAQVCGVSEQAIYNLLRETKVIEEKKAIRAEERERAEAERLRRRVERERLAAERKAQREREAAEREAAKEAIKAKKALEEQGEQIP